MIATKWLHSDLDEIVRIEKILQDLKFTAEPSSYVVDGFLSWLVDKKSFSSSSGEECVTTYRYTRTVLGRQLSQYKYGDITFRVRKETYEKMLASSDVEF